MTNSLPDPGAMARFADPFIEPPEPQENLLVLDTAATLPQKDYKELPDLEDEMSQKHYYVTIKPGELCKIHETEDKELRLETLQKAVGGSIEMLPFNVEGTPVACWVDEEGALKTNTKPTMSSEYGVLLGPICITGQEPEIVGMSKAFARKVKEHFDRRVTLTYPDAQDPG